MSADRLWEYHLRLQNGDVWPVVVHSRGPRFVPELGRVAAIFDEDYPDQRVPVAFFLSEGFLQSEIGLRYRFERSVELIPIGIQPMRVMPIPPRVGMHWAYFEQVFGASDGTGFDIRWSGSISREESVIVPAGTFHDCLRIESIVDFFRTSADFFLLWLRTESRCASALRTVSGSEWERISSSAVSCSMSRLGKKSAA